MISYRDLLILKLSETTQWKNAVEMYVPNSMMKEYWSDSYTCEFISITDKTYIIRSYYECGNKEYEEEYKNGKLNGKTIWWYENGKKKYEEEYKNDKVNGKAIRWYMDGSKEYEVEYKDGEFIRRIL